jgi:hypothetical protein
MIIERLHSDYQEEERLYSTGNDELDELLERAFCEGYEYAQREFGVIGKKINQMARNSAASRIRDLRRTTRTGNGKFSMGDEIILLGAKKAQKAFPKGQNFKLKNLKHV